MKKAHFVSTPQPAAPAPDRADAEQAARMLDRLAEMAMERAEAMHAASLAAIKAGDAATVRDLELSLDRVARGVRHTLALKAHLARERQEMADRTEAGARARAEAKDRRRRQVAGAVIGAIKATPRMPPSGVGLYSSAMWKRLFETEIDAVLALAGHPIEEIVLRLCRDIGIDPKIILPDEPARPDGGRTRKAQDEPLPAPPYNPEWWRYCILQNAKDGKPDGAPYWWDSKLKQRIDRPPWELKPDGSG
ncbi:hypothetical protein [Inquilinus sp. CA228]|uniref:hypothetical protein n=1 Tax=Inquilinus sp. CA228 TaxID=3455609 RepID=UPI003F8D828E